LALKWCTAELISARNCSMMMTIEQPAEGSSSAAKACAVSDLCFCSRAASVMKVLSLLRGSEARRRNLYTSPAIKWGVRSVFHSNEHENIDMDEAMRNIEDDGYGHLHEKSIWVRSSS
jgi:hypothetical protein